jgi:segregation and condensation protein B
MEFNLKKVLKTLLISTSEPVSIKDIQAVITRYHEQRERAEAARNNAADSADADGTDAADAPLTPLAHVTGVPHLATHDDTDGTDEDTTAAIPHFTEATQRVIQDIIDQVPTLLTSTQIREAADELNQEMADTGEVTRILQGPDGFRLVVSPAYAEWVRLLRNDPKPMRLSQAALETLTIVAYRQPVTRSEIEAIRGVSADSAVNRLVDLELVIVTGRADLPGRPIQYGTTEKFLDFCGLKTLGDLPASDVLSPSQISEWIARATNPVTLSDNDVGLAKDDGTERRGERTTLLSSEFDGTAPTNGTDKPPDPTP